MRSVWAAASSDVSVGARRINFWLSTSPLLLVICQVILPAVTSNSIFLLFLRWTPSTVTPAGRSSCSWNGATIKKSSWKGFVQRLQDGKLISLFLWRLWTHHICKRKYLFISTYRENPERTGNIICNTGGSQQARSGPLLSQLDLALSLLFWRSFTYLFILFTLSLYEDVFVLPVSAHASMWPHHQHWELIKPVLGNWCQSTLASNRVDTDLMCSVNTNQTGFLCILWETCYIYTQLYSFLILLHTNYFYGWAQYFEQ